MWQTIGDDMAATHGECHAFARRVAALAEEVEWEETCRVAHQLRGVGNPAAGRDIVCWKPKIMPSGVDGMAMYIVHIGNAQVQQVGANLVSDAFISNSLQDITWMDMELIERRDEDSTIWHCMYKNPKTAKGGYLMDSVLQYYRAKDLLGGDYQWTMWAIECQRQAPEKGVVRQRHRVQCINTSQKGDDVEVRIIALEEFPKPQDLLTRARIAAHKSTLLDRIADRVAPLILWRISLAQLHEEGSMSHITVMPEALVGERARALLAYMMVSAQGNRGNAHRVSVSWSGTQEVHSSLWLVEPCLTGLTHSKCSRRHSNCTRRICGIISLPGFKAATIAGVLHNPKARKELILATSSLKCSKYQLLSPPPYSGTFRHHKLLCHKSSGRLFSQTFATCAHKVVDGVHVVMEWSGLYSEAEALVLDEAKPNVPVLDVDDFFAIQDKGRGDGCDILYICNGSIPKEQFSMLGKLVKGNNEASNFLMWDGVAGSSSQLPGHVERLLSFLTDSTGRSLVPQYVEWHDSHHGLLPRAWQSLLQVCTCKIR